MVTFIRLEGDAEWTEIISGVTAEKVRNARASDWIQVGDNHWCRASAVVEIREEGAPREIESAFLREVPPAPE